MHRQLGDLAEWGTPEAGMFFWFKLLLRNPAANGANGENGVGEQEDDSEALVQRAVEHGVIALPGTTFLANGGRTAYVRASFSLQTPENIEEALRRLREVVLEARDAKEGNNAA